jgi:hypothetical protein
MTPDEIRALNLALQGQMNESDSHAQRVAGETSLKLSLFTEFVAQIAEISGSLRKIANPQVSVGKSPWVQLSWRGQSFVVHRDDVSAVFQYRTSKTESVVVRRGEVGQDSGHCCEMPLWQLCAKLNIPYKEPA